MEKCCYHTNEEYEWITENIVTNRSHCTYDDCSQEVSIENTLQYFSDIIKHVIKECFLIIRYECKDIIPDIVPILGEVVNGTNQNEYFNQCIRNILYKFKNIIKQKTE